MKITKGPMLEQFATVFGVPCKEVVAWVNAYVNTPAEFRDTEPNEQARLDSIKAYITRRLEESTTGRIKAAVALEQLKEAA